MPTRIATLGREKTLATLARHLYQIEDDAALTRATAALLAANPRLADRAGFVSGATIRVPAIPGINAAAPARPAMLAGSGLTGEAARRLQGLASRIEDGFQQAQTQRAEALAQITDRRFLTQAAKVLPDSRGLLQQATEALKAQEDRAKIDHERLAQTVQQALDGLAALEKLGVKPGPQ